MKKTAAIAAIVVVGIASFLLGWSLGPKAAPAAPAVNLPVENQAKTVSLMVDFGDGAVKTFVDVAYAENETLFDVTKRALEESGVTFQYQPPGPYGILVDQIGDKKGGTDGKYWLWWENGRMGQVASDAFSLRPGDVVEWKFINLKM